jgi:transcription elongation factor GreA
MAPNQKIQFTKQGLAELVAELTDLKDHKLPAGIDRVSRARDFGDLSENAEYHAAKDELSFLQGRVDELESIIEKAEVVEIKSTNGKVAIGSRVTVTASGKEFTYEIVGEWEADPVKKKISHTSPLGEAMLGKKPGDTVEFEAPAGKIVYKIKKLH